MSSGCAARRLLRAQILGEVGGAHDQRGEPRARAGDRFGMEDAERRLQHAPQGERRRRARGDERGLGAAHGLGALDLGQQHGIGLHLCRRGEIILGPLRRQRVDPHHQFAPAVAAGGERGGNPAARFGFLRRRDRVFEIEDESVGGERARLLQRARIRAGHEERAAARPRRPGHGPARLSRRSGGAGPRRPRFAPPDGRGSALPRSAPR